MLLRRTLLRRTTMRPTTANVITAEARKRGLFELMLTAPPVSAVWLCGRVLGRCEVELRSIVVNDADGGCDSDARVVVVGEGAGSAVGIFLSVGAAIMDMEKLRLITA